MEFLVNAETDSAQEMPGLTALAGGGFVVAWHDASGTLGDSSGTAIKARLFVAYGLAQGGEFLVNTEAIGDQYSPSLTVLSNGGFVVAWRDASGTLGDSSATSIKARLYDGEGSALGDEFLVNAETAGSQVAPRVTALADGGFVITWQDASGTGGDASATSIKARLFDGAGTAAAGDLLVNSEPFASQYTPGITALAGGGFVVAWQDHGGTLGDALGSSIKARLFDGAGTAAAGELLVNTEVAGFQFGPSLTALAQGGFVVAWYDYSGTLGDSSGSAIKARIFDGAGVAQGAEFLVNAETVGDQSMPCVTALAGGGFVVTWKDSSGIGGDMAGSAIKARVFGSDGLAQGGEFLVNTETAGDHSFAAVTALADGGFIVAWQDASGTGGDTSATSIKAHLFDATGIPLDPALLIAGTAGRNVLAGTAALEVILGRGGDDRLVGLGGDDRLAGGTGNDTLFAGAGDDTLIGGLGADVFRGGVGNDLADFAGTMRITVDVSRTGYQITGEGRDKLLGVENLAGGSRGDVLKGNAASNLLIGRDGRDKLEGRAGADGLDGGAGADTLFGGGGNDRLTGGAGIDALVGGKGADVFVFTTAADSGTGAGLRDVIADFAAGADRIDLSTIDTDPVAVGDQGFTFIGAAAFSGTAAEVRIQVGARKSIAIADVDGNGTADFEIELTGASALVASDFLL